MKPALAVLGASGRMGRAVLRLAHEAGLTIACAVAGDADGRDAGDLAGIGALGVRVTSDISAVAGSGADVLVDFSAPAALRAVCGACAEARIALVSGTTGLDAAAEDGLDRASREIPVLWEPNMSVGVHVLSALVERAAALLGPSYDIEVVEAHHRGKVDAPSGTARRLADVARGARGAGRDVHGREGRPGPRKADEIGVHAVRGGDVVGDHTVYFLGEGERIELVHRASSRDLFARGALRAAAWLADRPPGRYTLRDVLG